MNILLIGSGGREHAIAWKLSQSKKLDKLFIAPGNAGTAQLGENIDISPNDFENIGRLCLEKNIAMVIVGPEEPLVKGIRDFFDGNPLLTGISLIGPNARGAMLEGSKDFAKNFMNKYNIPTARHFTATIENIEKGVEFMKSLSPPYVLKADGLAAGKGVLIPEDFEIAKDELKNILAGKFGTAGNRVVIEEFLKGIELSVFVVTDGKNYQILPEAKDYKRIGERDSGPNTGGMGSVSPVGFASKKFLAEVEDKIIKPTINGLIKEEIHYQGFIFFGLINVKGNPIVIEYNCRMGDPETEAVFPRIKTDIIDIFEAVKNQTLNKIKIDTDPRYVASVMLVSGGYPDKFDKGFEIKNLDLPEDGFLFHSGTKLHEGKVLTNGGRVMAISCYGNSLDEALENSLKIAEKIEFNGKYFRKDIGFDLQ